ncbi:NAD(P)/FAD-dependent oxidoreductase [Microtetraspora fusca]|uniref:NAD(P)/FAD-dependent oxidoreductase n=1 Tax=Microtetraspora fusca TaxID=1997 RepID=UPI0008359CB9|nr:FAD-dependent oxidoreductase [Microtetraspora fusca]
MSENGLLIIGSSQAGVQLAVSSRALGYAAPVTLLGDENHRPYQRPALSKDFLQDKITKESLIFRSQEFWDEHRITVVKGERIEKIVTTPDGTGTAWSTSGRAFPFGRLALTVGARARRLDVPGAGLDGVLYLRNADDALELKARTAGAERVVVIGGGFIGIEAAAGLHALGKRVTLLEFADRLVARAVGAETSRFILDHHRRAGIDIRLGSAVDEIVGHGGKVRAVRAGGEEIAADIVLVGIGVVPNTELAEEMGLRCDNGIVVDRHAVASDGTTLAVGDCANLPNPVPGSPAGERVRFESVNHAIEQAKVAAHALIGRQGEYAGIPWFWSNQGDLKLQIAGLSSGYDRTVVRSPADPLKHSVLYYRGDRLVAADCVNVPLDFMAVKQALTKGVTLPPDAVADPAVPLRSLLAEVAAPDEGNQPA